MCACRLKFGKTHTNALFHADMHVLVYVYVYVYVCDIVCVHFSVDNTCMYIECIHAHNAHNVHNYVAARWST